MMAVQQQQLYVSARHEEWLKANPNAKYSRQALDFAIAQLRAEQRDRTKSFSASSVGGCVRAAQFQYQGLAQKPVDSKTAQIFHNGSHMHLRWQMAGLTAGWLDQAEVFCHDKVRMLKGSLDGILDNGWGLELKSINSYGFSRVMQYGVKPEHQNQIDAYFLMRPDIDRFSVIYENKDTQDYTEIIVSRETERLKQLEARLMLLKRKTLDGSYFDMRDDCWKGEGFMFRSCPYSPICKDQGDTFSIG